ncbi:putative serine protease K12H4.7 [Paramacrobiotus metropolitanus]|uniref:putative serine protease K12H4.7 n=1 Tax=Paramacrobiotus metropolitanus TaxID=2943436 RepID=UPI002445A842|nr:putative serine protease K12H4.7 [Paramacrobiotus metropolitanus]XP_055328721.1 putative serine protease K12H4.7 [Paramacrobiotus metropolitanus]
MESGISLLAVVCCCLWLIALCGVSESRSNFMLGKYRGSAKGQPARNRFTQNTGDLPPDQYFEQQLNHFNEADNRTWQQRFFVNDKYYKPGGPVFVMIGGEGPENPIWMVEGQWIRWAEKFNALCFNLEHRFYGKSHPTPDLSTENLRFLSSEQALADLANFITNQTASRGIKKPKVITFGGSYPGSLSAWFRSKYPHIVHAAISSSAPVVAVEDFTQYLEVVKNSLARFSPQCVDNVAAASAQLEEALQKPVSTKKLQTQFQLCTPIDVTVKKDVQNLVESLAGNFEGVVQYNRDNRAFEGALATNITIETLCDIMGDTSKGTALERYAQVNALLLNAYEQKCLNFTYQSFLDPLLDVQWSDSTSEGGRQWTYQTCTEFGFFQTSDSASQPFSSMFPLKFFVDQCKDLFNISEPVLQRGIQSTNLYYGGLDLHTERVMFVNGDIDPWHALGITRKHGHDSPAILIKGAAHCADMYPSRDEDIPELVLSRLIIEYFLEKWIVL